MSKQIFFAHSAGAQDGPGQGSYDLVEWLKRSLGPEYQLRFPLVAEPEAPSTKLWQELFERELAAQTGEILLMGHSLGGSMLLKYFSEHATRLTIQGLILISTPYWGTKDWDYDEFALQADFPKYLPEIPAIHIFHSLHDPVVAYEHALKYRDRLPQARLHPIKGNEHVFAQGLPELLTVIPAAESAGG